MDNDTGTQGTMDNLKGKAQEAWGNVTGNQQDQAEGQEKQVKGNVEQAAGNLKDAWNDATDNTNNS